jgi:aspartate aminotransferase
MKVSKMADQLIGSEIIKLATEIKQRIKEGEPIFNLTIGDFDPAVFPIPEAYSEEIKNAYQRHETSYPAANGMPELRQAISQFIHRKGGLEYSPDDILVSSGARPLIYATYMSLVDPGDKVIFPVPSWNNNHYSHMGGCQTVVLPTDPAQNFMPTAELLAPHVQDATLIALCSPLNPTGTIFSKPQLAGICEMVLAENERRGPEEKPLYLLYDQIYWNLVYGDNQHLNPVSLYPEMKDYTVCVDGMSKAFCATGVRVGWGYGPSHVIQKMKSILSHVGAWAPKPEQMATGRYLSQEDKVDAYLEDLKDQLRDRLRGFYQGFQELKAQGQAVDAIAPQAALYLTVKFDLVGMVTETGKTLENHAQVHRYLLDEALVALVPFKSFGANDSPWYRLSVGTVKMEDIPQIMQRLADAIGKLSPARAFPA